MMQCKGWWNVIIVYTEYAGHAQSLIKDYDLSNIDAIIIAAGDGLLYEVSLFILQYKRYYYIHHFPYVLSCVTLTHNYCARTIVTFGWTSSSEYIYSIYTCNI